MKRLLSLALGSALIGVPLQAQYVPHWWLENSNPVLTPGAPSQNNALANTGQLKWMAKRAKAHFDAAIPGGASPAINALVAGFKPQAGVTYSTQELADIRRDNYAPVNLGQIKAVALLFYDQLWNLSPRYDTNLNLKANGYPSTWASQYPWASSIGNYRPATLGQLKLVFSFDIVDSNGNGIKDYLEGIYPAYNATRDTDGDGVFDVEDAYPNDPARAVQLVSNPGDTIGPTITLTKPTGATLVP